MAKIDVFRAANTTGIAINSRRITKTKPYGFVETVQSYDVNNKGSFMDRVCPYDNITPMSITGCHQCGFKRRTFLIGGLDNF